MTEVEKMYENAGVEPYKYCYNCFDNNGKIIKDSKDCPSRKSCCNTCDTPEYNFTAEKQLAIFKMFCRRYLEVSQHVEENGDLCFGIKATVGDFAVSFNEDFTECLAGFVNYLWQSLTDVEKEQVKEILE